MCVIALENRRARIPGIDDQLCDGARADIVRHVHGREGQVAVEHEHGTSAGCFVLGEFRLQRLAFRRVGVFTFGDDDAARPGGYGLTHRLQLFVRGGCHADGHGNAAFGRRLDHALRYGCEVGIGDIGDQQHDVRCGAFGHCLSIGVGTIVELGGCFHHLDIRLVAYLAGAAVEHTGCGGDGDLGFFGDVHQCRWRLRLIVLYSHDRIDPFLP